MRIFANHAHIIPAEFRENCGIDGLREVMADCGIEKAVCFAPLPYQMVNCQNRDSCRFLYEQMEGDPALVGFGTVDFEREDLTAQVEKMAEYGFRGIKIHPAAQEIHVFGEQARQVYAAAERLGLFISFHTGIHWRRIAEYHPLLFDEVAFFYPKLKFSMEHIGGYHFFRDALAVLCNNSRNDAGGAVYAGWTSIFMPADGIPDEWSLSDLELKTLLYQVGDDTSLFGLDYPYRRGDTTKRDIERILQMDIPEESKEKIFGKNLAAALGLAW